ncbi:MAG: polymer-forming cytoskeletal protein [Calditrichia bacterium]|nr:polymer-forming cytoskeletal protein [Calditrichia bacterium]
MGFKSSETTVNSNEMNFFGKGTYVEGQIVAESNLRIDGKVKGKVITKNMLHVGPSGRIDGEIEAKDAVIGGKVKGKITISNKLELEAKAELIGDLNTKILIIDEGAVFRGNSIMGEVKTDVGVPVIKKEFEKK